MNNLNFFQIDFNWFGRTSKNPTILLLALAVIPVYWGSYDLNGCTIMMGVSFIGLCLMKVYEVDNKNVKLLADTIIKGLKVLKG